MYSPIYMPLILCSDYKVIIREREREREREKVSVKIDRMKNLCLVGISKPKFTDESQHFPYGQVK